MARSKRLLAWLLVLTLCNAPALHALGETAPAATEEASADDAAVESAVATEAGNATAEDSEASLAELPLDTVLATVGDVNVTWFDAQFIFRNLLNTYTQYGLGDELMSLIPGLQGQALQYAVELEIMVQKAAELNITLTEEEETQLANEVSLRWNGALDQIVAQNPAITSESTDEDKIAARGEAIAELNAEGYTEQSMVASAKEVALLEKLQDEVLKDVTVSEEELQAAIDERVKRDEEAYASDIPSYEYAANFSGETVYYVPAGYRGVTHILLDVDSALLDSYKTLKSKLEAQEETSTVQATATEAPAGEGEAQPEETPVTQAEVDAARQAILGAVKPQLDEINTKLKDGVSFAELVAAYGKDPGMTQEPAKSEGYRVHHDSVIYDQAFTDGAFTLDQIGQVSEPVISTFGVHLIHYLNDVPAGPVPVTEDMRAALQQQLKNQKDQGKFQTLMEEWKAASTITYTADGQKLLDALEAKQ